MKHLVARLAIVLLSLLLVAAPAAAAGAAHFEVAGPAATAWSWILGLVADLGLPGIESQPATTSAATTPEPPPAASGDQDAGSQMDPDG